jgi:hypothetical protein
MKTWTKATKDAVVSGSLASVLSNIALAAGGARESGSPFAPINAVSHWFYGDRAAEHDELSMQYSVVGYAIHHTAATFWAVFYEKWFGEAAENRDIVPALAGGMAVSSLACFVDYKMTPHRLQPGYEMRLSKRSLFIIYAALGAGLAMRGLLVGKSR